MRNILIFILLCSPVSAYALNGMITSLEVPLFKGPDTSSKIVQYVRLGETIYIHPKHRGLGPADFDYQETSSIESELEELTDAPFYATMDKSGNTVYILKEHVKLIHKDSRELDDPLSSTKYDHDPMDYRLRDPLPPNYPLYDKIGKYRGDILLGIGPAQKTSYPYNSTIRKETFNSRKGISLTYLKNSEESILHQNRQFYGGEFHFFNQESTFTFDRLVKIREVKNEFGLGLHYSYYTFRSPKYGITLDTTLALNYHRHTIEKLNTTISEEPRTFSSLAIAPKFGALFFRRQLLSNINFVIKGEIEITLPYDLETSSSVTTSDAYWTATNDVIDVPFGGRYTLYVGVMGLN